METMRSRTKPNVLMLLCALVASVLFLAACGPSANQTAATVAPAPALESAATTAVEAPTAPPAGGGEAYPPPTQAAPAEAYPSDPAAPPTVAPEAYPPASETFQEPRFRIDQPVAAGATTITGQAPPGTALAVMDVTYNGALLGTGRSDESGRFTIPVSGLVAGNRIGLAIGELTEGQTLNQMAEQYYPYRGEGFMNLPNVGIFFDTVLVEP
jgi:hypothetical protein